MLYRSRIVFNGPGATAYQFYSTPVPTEAQVDEMLASLKEAGVLVHAVSVKVQRQETPQGAWWTRSTLTHVLSEGKVSEWQI